MKQSPIVERLSSIRQVARRRLLLFGIFAVLAGGIAAFFTILLVDWLVWLPPLLRIASGSLFLIGYFAATFHWIVKPLRAQLTIQELAGKIEKHFSPLQDRLASSVNFLERGDIASSAMAQHVVAATENDIRNLPLESALAGGPVTRRALALAAMTTLLVGTLWWAPQWIGLGARRYLSPWSDVEWPRKVAIVPGDASQMIALGDAMTVSMRVERGWSDGLRAVVHVREQDGATSAITLQHEGDAVFSANIGSVTQDLTYWFEAGDASTQKRPSTVRVVRRPEIVEATAIIEAPPYASNLPTKVVDLRDGAAEATLGGTITVHLVSSKSVIGETDIGRAGLQIQDGGWIPLETNPEEPMKLSARWTVDRDLQFRAVLRDEHGFENRGPALYLLRAAADAPPDITILEPPPVCEVTSKAMVPVVLRAEDDFGIDGVHLFVEQPNLAPSLLPIESVTRSVTSDAGTQLVGSLLWDMASYALAPGDVISYHAVARDNFRSDDAEGHQTASAPMRIKILSDGEFELRVREDLTALEEKLRRSTFDQAALHDDTEALESAAGELELGDAQRNHAASLSAAQTRIARQIRDAATRLDDIARRVERNTADDDERARIASLAESLRTLAGGPMAGASALLSRARGPGDAQKSQSALRQAAREQQAALAGMRDVLRSMGQWGVFQGVASRTRDLLERQTQLRLQTAELGKSTLGKPVEVMEPEKVEELRRNQRRQELLSDDVKEHLSRLEQMRLSLAEKDATAADAVDASLRSARADDLVRHVEEAAGALSANRAGAAETHQRAASQALQRMLSALHEREARELAQLRKRLDDAARQVDDLIEEQKTVIAETQGKDELTESESETLGSQQRTLARNAKFLGEELMEEESTADAGRMVRQAGPPMTDAENDLVANNPRDAALNQETAVALLTDARETLLAAQEEAFEEMLRRTLEEIHQELEALLAAQQAINRDMLPLRDALAATGRLSRAETRDTARLAKEQLDARALVAGLLPDMEQVAVYRWALERVGRWMAANHEALEARKLDEDTIAAAGRIVRDIEHLIAALVQTKTMPLDTEFTESGDGESGGKSDGNAQPPLPTMAELLVLKTMQNDINARTAAVYTRYDAQHPAEQALREITILGEDQAQVQQLTQMVADRARQR